MNVNAIAVVARLLESDMSFVTPISRNATNVYHPDGDAEDVYGVVNWSAHFDVRDYGIKEITVSVQHLKATLDMEGYDGSQTIDKPLSWTETVVYPSTTEPRPEGDPETADPKRMAHYYAQQQPWEAVIEMDISSTHGNGRLVLLDVEIDFRKRKITFTFGST